MKLKYRSICLIINENTHDIKISRHVLLIINVNGEILVFYITENNMRHKLKFIPRHRPRIFCAR